MKTLTRSLLLALALTTGAWVPVQAQSPLPQGTAPFSGEITVRYTPTFESRCTSKQYEKKPGEFFGSRTTEIVTYGVFEDLQGVPKLSAVTNVGANYMRIVLGLKPDGSGFASNELEFQTDIPMPTEAKDMMKEILSNMMKKNLGLDIEFPLRLGSDMSMDICELFPQGRTIKKAGRYAVIGMATIRGRESIIIGGEQTFTCTIADKQLSMQVKIWRAIDRQSGLSAGSSLAGVSTEPGQGNTTFTDDTECVISGSLTRAPKAISPGSSGVKSIEQRLIELKALMDKGLISKEQYEQKRVEILKAL